MKKTLINACMAIALVAIAGSCSNEELIEMEQTPLGELELSATIGTSTRTIIGEDGKMTWVTGDAFYAWGNNSNSTATFTLHEGAGKTTGLFSGKLESGYAEYLEEVVYPKSMVKRDGKKVIVDMKSVSFDNSSAPMYGTIASGNVEFNNLVSMLRVTINNLPENATLSVSGKGIAGEATLVDGELTGFSTTTQTIQVTGIPAGTQTIDIPVYPTGQRVSISFAINNGKKYTLPIQPEKGKVLKSSIPELSYVNNDLAIVWDGSIDTGWYKDNKMTLTLSTPSQLAGLAKIVAGDSNSGNNLKGKTIQLKNSFDMANLPFDAIGSYGSSKSFSGIFDGKNKTISGLKVVNTNERGYAGLFGSVGGATVKNLTITNSYFEAENCGCVAGYLYGDISLDKVLVTNSIAKENGTEYENKLIGNEGNGTGNVDGVVLIFNSAKMEEAIKNNVTKMTLSAGTYIIPDVAKGKNLTFIGSGNPEETKIAVQDDGSNEGDCDYSLEGATVIFNNVTIETTKTYFPGYVRMKGTYNNCIINGVYTLYGNSTFEECTFNVSGDFYNLWTWGAEEAIFTGCTFNSDGKAILLYGQANTKLTVEDCIFNDKGGLSDLKAAIEIGNDYDKSYELIVNRTTVNGYEINDKGINTGTTLWANKNSMPKDKLNVVVDGVDVY